MDKTLASFNHVRRRLARDEYQSIYVAPWKFRSEWVTDGNQKVIFLSHTSFTLYSYFELPSFSSKSDMIFREVSQADGYIGHTSAFSPWTKTLDTITAWESVDAIRAFYRSKKHGEVLRGFYAGDHFSKTPRWYIERFECPPSALEPCVKNSSDYNTALQFWERVLSINDDNSNDSEIIRVKTKD